MEQVSPSRTDRAPRLLVVVAHPDDETFGCGSLLLHAAASGAVTAVCCATRGEAGEPAPGSGVRPDELGTVRERELRAAAAVLGVSRVDVLDFRDSGMTGDAGPTTLVAADVDDVRDAVLACIESFEPDVVVTLDASDGHRDHARIRDATVAAVGISRWPVGRTYLHCLLRSLLQRWLDEAARHRPDTEYLSTPTLGTPDEQITTVIDTASHRSAREAAIALHASQTSPFEGMPDDLRRDFLTTDHMRRVLPPWKGGPVEATVFGGSTSSSAS